MESACWVIEIETDGPLAPLETGLEQVMGAVALANFRPAEDAPVILQAFFDAEPDETRLAAMLGRACAGAVPDYRLYYHPPRDWLAENRADFPPLALGRFWVHGSHIAKAPAGRLALQIDAALAFGSGSHPTTAGCLAALQRLAKKPGRPGQVLDLGCGSAILAMAAGRLWPDARIIASDIDREAVETSRQNIRKNQIGQRRCQTVQADGLQSRALQKSAPYQLILANILAAPLRDLAPAVASVLDRRGWLVLAGLLDSQARSVLAAYRAQQLVPVWQNSIEGWRILVLRPAAAGK